MSKQKIYLVYDCDEWKTFGRMRLALATTSVRRVEKFIVHKIEVGDFNYQSPENSRASQVSMFTKDFEWLDRNTINGLLEYGYFDYTIDGEEI